MKYTTKTQETKIYGTTVYSPVCPNCDIVTVKKTVCFENKNFCPDCDHEIIIGEKPAEKIFAVGAVKITKVKEDRNLFFEYGKDTEGNYVVRRKSKKSVGMKVNVDIQDGIRDSVEYANTESSWTEWAII